MKKRREKAVLVDRISRWLFPTRLIRYMQILTGESAPSMFHFFCQKTKVSVVKSLKSPLCELLGKSKGDQNFSMLLNPEEKVVKLFQGSSPRSTAFIFDLCLPISGLFLRISSPSLSVSSCWTLSTGLSLETTTSGDPLQPAPDMLPSSWLWLRPRLLVQEPTEGCHACCLCGLYSEF